MIRVAAYCRVSTDSADQANSFASQQRFFREYIDRNPQWELAHIYADEGITGTSTRKRKAFNRMLSDARQGAFSLILTKEISRFSRNILDTIRCTRQLRDMGVGVLFLTERLNSLDPEAELLLTFMGVLAQEESRRTSVRVKWGQTRRMEQGVVFGRSLLGYRVAGGRLTVVPEQAELVRLIFRKYALEGKGTAAIARELQESGFRTAAGGTEWHASHIVRILKNEKYVGDLIQKKSITPDYLTHARRANRGQEELVVLHEHHEPIVSRELWNAAQRELQRRSRGQGSGHGNRYLFSGKIRCGLCGACFVSRVRGDLHRWACASAVRSRGGCTIGKLIRDDDAMEMLRAALESLCLDQEMLVRAVLERLPAEEGTEKLRRRREALLRKREAALDAYCAGDLTREELRRRKDDYDCQIIELDQRISKRQEQPELGSLVGEILREGSEMLYRSILESLTVFPDRHMELRLKGLPHIFCFR